MGQTGHYYRGPTPLVRITWSVIMLSGFVSVRLRQH